MPSTLKGKGEPLVAAVIPTYRAGDTIVSVVRSALEVAHLVIVVDDACPGRSGSLVTPDDRVVVVTHSVNRGVGAATKTGISEAMRRGSDVIVKIDSDGQMDPAFVPQMVSILRENPDIAMVKGNRFADSGTLRTMPTIRLIGNSVLTLLVKISSGYWTLVDPTNGFIALRTSELGRFNFNGLAERYFFEIDLICLLGLDKRSIAELAMPAIYAGAPSSLAISRVLLSFPGLLIAKFLRRVLINYLIVELNVGSLCGLIGIPLLIVGTIFGSHEWALSTATGVPRPTGTIILALLLFVIGFQLTLQAALYDVQYSPRTLKISTWSPHHIRRRPQGPTDRGPVDDLINGP